MTARAQWAVAIAVVAAVILLQVRDWYAALAVALCGLLFVRTGLGLVRGARRKRQPA